MNIFSLRPELVHPLFVHFPISFTVFAFLTYVVALRYSSWESISRYLHYGALAFLLAALFTGDFAGDIVKRDLCDVHVLHEHEEHAYQTLYFLLAALAMDLVSVIAKKKLAGKTKWLAAIKLILLLGANISLFITGHYGAKLVYEQGAAVIGAKIECK